MEKQGLLKEIKNDLPASIVVFFVAVPLCLGIALASGAPLFSGIIAGIVGGIVVGIASGSAMGVSGPAAGLAVVVLSSIAALGSWPAFLMAVVLAGLIQIALGFAKAGFVAYFFPSSVIKGMLSGIGLLIILKQIPHALGYDKDSEGDDSFFQNNGENTFSSISNALDLFTPGAILISIVSLAILILWDTVLTKKHKIFQLIQGPIVVVFFGIFMNYLFQNNYLNFSLSAEHVVNLPEPKSFSEFLGLFTFPDFSVLTSYKVYEVAVVLAIIASIETLLSVEATDKLDPARRITPTNRELKAQGLGNVISGLIGGLPITQVIVRSSANINFGGKTKMSTILHGIFLLISAILLTPILNLLPLASLAAILLMVGYKLTKPSLFKQMYTLGWTQFIPFVSTIVGIILTDLLKGITIGILFGIFYVLRESYRNSHLHDVITTDKGQEVHHISLAEEVSFFNKANILQALDAIPKNSRVIIDYTKSKAISFDVIELINDYEKNASTKNIVVDNNWRFTQPQIKEVMKTLTKEIQDSISPAKALEILKSGNTRFTNNLKVNRNLLQQANETSDGQHPFAVILSCIDSRTSAELIFDQGLGDIFSVRVAGNIVNEDILGSMEFACKVAGAKIIVVLGHTKCGAIKGACDHVEMGNLTALLSKIRPAVDDEATTKENRNSSNDEFVEKVATINVKRTVKAILERSPILKEMIESGTLGIAGGNYDVSSGEVEFYDDATIIK